MKPMNIGLGKLNQNCNDDSGGADQQLQWLCSTTRNWTLSRIGVVSLGIMFASVSIFVASSRPFFKKPVKLSKPKWDEKLNHPSRTTCEQTPIFPFRVGCPSSCTELRHDDLTNQTEHDFYRTALMFYFGQADKYPLGGPMPPRTAYATGINFQCSQELVHNFVEATHSLKEQSEQTFGNRIHVDRVPEIHLSLMYLCCLTKDEAMMANQLF